VNKFVHQACLLLLRNFATYQGSSPYAGITIALLDEEGFELSPELKALSGVHWIFPANSKEDALSLAEDCFPCYSQSRRIISGGPIGESSFRNEAAL
jgi:hypothetical protein